MTGIAQRLLRVRPVRRLHFLQFSSLSADSKSPPLSPDIPNAKSEAVKSVFAYLNDFRAYLKGDPKTGNRLNPVSSKVSPPQEFTNKLGDLLKRFQHHFTAEAEAEAEEEKTLQRLDTPGAIDVHRLNDPNEKLDGSKANVEDCCKCCTLFALSKAWMNNQTMDETAISIIKAMDEQTDLTLEERFVLAQKLMSNPTHYAMFKAYKGEERVLFLQSLLKF